MLDVREVPLTHELADQKLDNDQWFRSVAEACIPRRCKLIGCQKCDGGEYHRDHASPYDLEKSDEAYSILTSQQNTQP